MEKEFMIRSKVLEKLKQRILDANKLIWDSVHEKRPILIRHHADCDGYCGAVALERAILSVLEKVHRRESDVYYYYRRLPSRTPYYDYSDATKDISFFLTDMTRHGHKAPLIIVVDNGSSAQDLMALRKLKLYGASLIVIDHHPNDPANDEFIDIHINPHLNGDEGSFTAGMMGAELAFLLSNGDDSMALLAALAGVGDKSSTDELLQYIKISDKKGFPRERLLGIAEAVDYEAYNIGFSESREQVNDLLFGDIERQYHLVELIHREIDRRIRLQKIAVEHYAEIEELDDRVIARVDLDQVTKQGEFPLRGKTTGLLRDHAMSRYSKPVLAYGFGTDFMTFRFSNGIDVDVNEIISLLRKKFPHSLVDGGGHPMAGSISFVKASRDDVLREVIEYLRTKA